MAKERGEAMTNNAGKSLLESQVFSWTTVKFLLWTMMIITVLIIFLFIVQSDKEGLTPLALVDTVFFPAVVVFLGFLLNETVRTREKARDEAARKRERDRDVEQAENEIRKDFLMRL